jgi:hypothetical protein
VTVHIRSEAAWSRSLARAYAEFLSDNAVAATPQPRQRRISASGDTGALVAERARRDAVERAAGRDIKTCRGGRRMTG